VNRTIGRRGVLVIPSFAVGRAQLLLYYLHQLRKQGAIPKVPIYLNSPMASHTNEVMLRAAGESRLSREQMEEICETAKVVSSPEESIELNERHEPMIIIAASGMAAGGRVLHHLKAFAPDPKNTILFTGFQAGGTRGEAIVNGAKEIKIHGAYWPMRAEVDRIDSMSAHADQGELLTWLKRLPRPPKCVFVNHGEPEAADTFRRKIEETLHVKAITPEQLQSFNLD
ncbi:MAG: MBL fold metallo-hydrolase RNA specificity domain-containing protein, partial [Bdellovibrionota bacterium]